MVNRSTITIDTKTAENILEEIEAMRKSLETLRKKIMTLLPSKYGSYAWWEKEINEGLKEVKEGNLSGPFKNADELIKALHQEARA